MGIQNRAGVTLAALEPVRVGGLASVEAGAAGTRGLPASSDTRM